MELLSTAKSVADAVYPSGFRCYACGRELEENEPNGVCAECVLPLNDGKICLHCGRPVSNEADYCENCMNSHGTLYKIRAPLIYTGSAKTLIRGFKFGRKRYLTECFYPLIRKTAEDWTGEVDCVVPVPLSKKKLNRRGYNQAELLSDEVARTLRVPVIPALIKIKELKKDQARLSAAKRAESVRGCYAYDCASPIAGKRVLIVDDVMTTGSTLEECARILSPHRPASIGAIVLAVSKQRINLL